MSDNSMRNALACRMFDGWSFKESCEYAGILEAVTAENKKTTDLFLKIQKIVWENFMQYPGKYSYYRKMDSVLKSRLEEFKRSEEGFWIMFDLEDMLGSSLSLRFVGIPTDFIYDVFVAEKCFNFADRMLEEGKEGIALTLPIKENLVKIIANYENNKSRVSNFMEVEFPVKLKRQEEIREKLSEILKVVEDLLEERKCKKIVNTVKQECAPAERTTTVKDSKTLCEKISDWWSNL